MKPIRIVFGALGVLILLVLFQNCSNNSFEALPSQVNLGSSSQSGGEVPNPNPTATPTTTATVTPSPTVTATPSPSTTPTVTPSPTASPSPTATTSPVSKLKKTQFYFSGGKTIAALELDHQTGAFTEKTSTTFAGSDAAWLAYEKSTGSVFVADASQSTLQVFSHNKDTAALTSRSMMTTSPAQVHLTVASNGSGFNLFGSSYNRGELSYYKINSGLNQLSRQQVITQGATAKTHSSSFDGSRGLLYVAALGLNKVFVYKLSDAQGLVEIADIAIEGARTVVYDSSYDKLYVVTEMYTGSSYIRVFSISGSGNSYSYTAMGSLAMPKAGGDLKINHAFGYAMGTAREAGKESIWALPLTAGGIADTTRNSFSISVAQSFPRALEVTEDGQYVVVGQNSAGGAGTLAFKLTFDAQKKFVSSQKVYQRASTNSSGYLGGVSIPIYGN